MGVRGVREEILGGAGGASNVMSIPRPRSPGKYLLAHRLFGEVRCGLERIGKVQCWIKMSCIHRPEHDFARLVSRNLNFDRHGETCLESLIGFPHH